MVAAPYKVSLAVKNASGQTRQIYLTASDVNAAAWVFPSTGTELPLSSLPSIITDTIYSAAVTDTSQVALYINGVDTGFRFVNAANVGTVFQRQIYSNPVTIPAGALVKFVQLT